MLYGCYLCPLRYAQRTYDRPLWAYSYRCSLLHTQIMPFSLRNRDLNGIDNKNCSLLSTLLFLSLLRNLLITYQTAHLIRHIWHRWLAYFKGSTLPSKICSFVRKFWIEIGRRILLGRSMGGGFQEFYANSILRFRKNICKISDFHFFLKLSFNYREISDDLNYLLLNFIKNLDQIILDREGTSGIGTKVPANFSENRM